MIMLPTITARLMFLQTSLFTSKFLCIEAWNGEIFSNKILKCRIWWIWRSIFRSITLCSKLIVNQCFRNLLPIRLMLVSWLACSLTMKVKRNVPLKCLLTFSGLHSIMIQKTDLLNTEPLKFHIPQIEHNWQLNETKIILAWGNGVDPVSFAYCRNTSFGFGPSMKNVSMMPLSDIKCESTWGGVADPDTKFTIDETTFWSAVPKISTHVSAAFNQKMPAVWVFL
jgi:hypothetical protein